ncbi:MULTISPECIES: hydroxypyruvate isomerase family protein [Paraburkholderia]|uniref:hydroxypyruvate isomerase family protein n=1 Tax=Paraburkholderia TaxID=1822464 RepID=UPI002252A044|nr:MULTISPECIES: TIM barrel protein [Paraburkholderia]MCX4163178.1 TIM barrel protein [Paraburkholderia megapolitana]MDN7158674.1 TIM barrel protein [Paraburkholderia sp. CHISQ3]MDQ6495721.1 TIM barrel protein [Paraburkholderia megapolitana]
MKLSAHLGFQFNEVPFYDRFELAARCGYHAVEFPSPYGHETAKLKNLLVSNGLKLVQIAAPMGDSAANEKGIAAFPGRREEFLAGLVTARDTALALDCPRIHVMAGVVRFDTDESWVTYVENVREAVDIFAAASIKTIVEVMSPLETPGYFMSSFELADKLFAAIPTNSLEFLFDTYHAAALSGDVVGLLKRWLPRLGHIQISDHPGRHEPGTGTLPFPEVFAELQRHGYSQWLGCEYRPLHDTVSGLKYLKPYLHAGQ